MQVIDIADPAAPVRRGWIESGGFGIAASDDKVALANRDLTVVEVSNPDAPAAYAGFDSWGTAVGVTAADGLLYLADRQGGLGILSAGGVPDSRSLYLPLGMKNHSWAQLP
jgi:hypothetical protein